VFSVVSTYGSVFGVESLGFGIQSLGLRGEPVEAGIAAQEGSAGGTYVPLQYGPVCGGKHVHPVSEGFRVQDLLGLRVEGCGMRIRRCRCSTPPYAAGSTCTL